MRGPGSEQEAALSSPWQAHLYRTGANCGGFDAPPSEPAKLRGEIEPWLSAVFQSEHLSLLTGSGLTVGVMAAAGLTLFPMAQPAIAGTFAAQIDRAAQQGAEQSGRGEANFEDYLRVSTELLGGLRVQGSTEQVALRRQINTKLSEFLASILQPEQALCRAAAQGDPRSVAAGNLLVSFLLSFASRAASRERLNVFTTNYDRFIERGCDLAGLRVIDRFVGALSPVFRASRLNIDLHYNPPGIRGEPRYLEGVIHLAKLHGSLDWRWEEGQIRRCGLPFGAVDTHPDIPREPLDSVMVYPNAAKDVETCEYPYAELFRDFAAAVCRPNSSLVTYGYGFGDDHVNRILRDMLTIPSTHLVIISYGDPGGRIQRFCTQNGHDAQVSLLLGTVFGSLVELVAHYLPKPAIDLISVRRMELVRRRDWGPEAPTTPGMRVENTAGGGNDADPD